MGDIFDLMVNETRESLFQLECIAVALDNKAYGLIAFDTILLAALAFFNEIYHSSRLIYLPTVFLFISTIFVLICIIPSTSHRMTGEKILHLYGEKDFEDAAGQLAFNYAGLEKELTEVYNKKLKFLSWGFRFTIAAMLLGAIVLSYIIFDP